MNDEEDKLIHSAWRDSESYAVPMTEEGQRLADQRFYGFRLGWIYAKFHSETGDIYRKDYLENMDQEHFGVDNDHN